MSTAGNLHLVRLALTVALVAAGCASSPSVAPAPSTTAAPPTSAAPAPSRPEFCPTPWEGRVLGRVTDPELNEISGAAFSRAHPGVLWVHNDSGNDAAVYAVAEDGSLLGRVATPDLSARDWEDLALGPGPGGVDHLYLADIGDNRASRDAVQIHRIPEPDLDATVAGGSQTLTVRYPDGPTEAETLLVDPSTGDIVIVGKALSGRTPVFIVPAEAPWGSSVEAGSAPELRLGTFALATGGDAGLTRIVIRTYDEVFLWERSPGESLAATLRAPGCRVARVTDQQGEAIALGPDEDRFITLSEGVDQPLHAFSP